MYRWVQCHLCGCTGFHYDPVNNTSFPCPNKCERGRIYEHLHRDWFDRMVEFGAIVHEEADNSLITLKPMNGTA